MTYLYNILIVFLCASFLVCLCACLDSRKVVPVSNFTVSSEIEVINIPSIDPIPDISTPRQELDASSLSDGRLDASSLSDGRLDASSLSDGRKKVLSQLDTLLSEIREGKEECVLLIGDLYMYGARPFFSSCTLTAGRIYTVICKDHHHFSSRTRMQARAKLKDMVYMHNDMDFSGMCESLPSTVYYEIVRLTSQLPDLFIPDNDDRHIIDHFHVDIEEQQRILDMIEMKRREEKRSDAQNVHDPILQKHAMSMLDQLNIGSNDLTRSDEGRSGEIKRRLIKRAMELGVHHPDIEKVLTSLTDSIHSRYQMSENDVLVKVWDSISSDDVKVENLCLQLKDAVEHGHVVCSSGKIVRMLSAASIEDQLKPTWVLEQEIMGKAAKLRDKEKLSSDCIRDYVDSGLLTREELDMVLDPILEHI